MYFNGVIAVVLWLNFVVKIHTVFYIKINNDLQLSYDNTERLRHCYTPQLKPNLYECKNEKDDNGWTVSDCRSVSTRYCKTHGIFNQINFFNTFEPEFEIGYIILLDGKDMQNPPAVMTLGVHPTVIDFPRFDPYPTSCMKIYDAINELKDGIYVEDDEKFVEKMVDYLCCNNILTCFLADPRRSSAILSVVRRTLLTIISAHEETILAQKRSIKLEKVPESEMDPFVEPLDWKLKRAMKMMIDKLIDPCIFQAHVLDEADESCKVYCIFLTATNEAFVAKTAPICKGFKSGSCHEGVCYCSKSTEESLLSSSKSPTPKSPRLKLSQTIKIMRRKVKMLSCDNELRQRLVSVLSPIVYNFQKKRVFEYPTLKKEPESDDSSSKTHLQRATPRSTMSRFFSEQLLRQFRNQDRPSPTQDQDNRSLSPIPSPFQNQDRQSPHPIFSPLVRVNLGRRSPRPISYSPLGKQNRRSSSPTCSPTQDGRSLNETGSSRSDSKMSPNKKGLSPRESRKKPKEIGPSLNKNGPNPNANGRSVSIYRSSQSRSGPSPSQSKPNHIQNVKRIKVVGSVSLHDNFENNDNPDANIENP